MFLKKWAMKKRFAVSKKYDTPLPPAAAQEIALVEELRSSIQRIPDVEPLNATPSEQEWFENSKRLRELVLNDDPREFLRWDVTLKTMVVTNAGYVAKELNYLQSRQDWDKRWSKAIQESLVGHPLPYWRHPQSSGNLIHHAYHIAQFEEKTDTRVDDVNFVFEFGGGYGSMCRLFYNLGFQGKYVIFDLPAFSALQKFFLKSVGIKVHSVDSINRSKGGTICISDIEELGETLLAHIDASNAMFIATWSISETPIKFRNVVLPLLSPFNAFLIAYQTQFKEIDNVDFFRSWTSTMKNIQWHDWQIKHIKNNNRYLIGKRKL